MKKEPKKLEGSKNWQTWLTSEKNGVFFTLVPQTFQCGFFGFPVKNRVREWCLINFDVKDLFNVAVLNTSTCVCMYATL